MDPNRLAAVKILQKMDTESALTWDIIASTDLLDAVIAPDIAQRPWHTTGDNNVLDLLWHNDIILLTIWTKSRSRNILLSNLPNKSTR